MAWLAQRKKRSNLWYLCTRVNGKIKFKSCKTHDETLARSLLKEFEAFELKRSLENSFGNFESIQNVQSNIIKHINICDVITYWAKYRDNQTWQKKSKKGQGVVLSYYNSFVRWCEKKMLWNIFMIYLVVIIQKINI